MADDEFDAEFYEATGIILGSGTIQAVRNFVAAREAAAAAKEREACGDVAGQVADEFRRAAYLLAAHGASHAAAAIRARGKGVADD